MFGLMRCLCLAVNMVFLISCSDAPSERAVKHESRGDDYVQHEQFREAVIEYRNAARAVPDNITLQWKLAHAASKVGDAATAYLALSRVVKLDPSHFEAKWSLGDLYLAAGRTEEGSKIAEELISTNPRHAAGYLLRARVALGSGKVEDAIALLRLAIERDSSTVWPLITLANSYVELKDFKQATEWYDRAVKADPNSAEARIARGQFLFAAGASEEGRKEFQRAVELSRDQEHIKLVLADRYVALGRREEAERELTGLIAEMNSTRARKVLAELRLTAGQVGEAKPLVAAILESDDRDPVGLYLKGRLALAESEVLQAVRLFEEAIGRNTALSGPHLYLGLVRLAQGRMDQAEEELGEATKLDPGDQTAHLALAKLYLTQQKADEAQKEAERTLRLNPSNLEAAVLYGDALMIGKNVTKAEEVYGAIIRQLPGQPLGYVKMAALRRLQERPAEAAQYFAQALAHAPTDRVVLKDYLAALVESKQEQRADAVLKAYLEKSPRDPNLWRVAGGLHVALRQMDRAEKALGKAVELAQDSALVHYELGQLYVLENKLPAAESAFQTALTKEETNSGVHTALGMVLARQGKVDAANDHYRRALQLDPHNAVAANNLAASLSDRHEPGEALGWALAAREDAPANPAIKDTLGWIYYQTKRFDDAQHLLAEASTALPQHPLVRYHHALALSKLGKQQEALAELKMALSLPGGFPGAERAAQMLAANKVED